MLWLSLHAGAVVGRRKKKKVTPVASEFLAFVGEDVVRPWCFGRLDDSSGFPCSVWKLVTDGGTGRKRWQCFGVSVVVTLLAMLAQLSPVVDCVSAGELGLQLLCGGRQD